MPDTSSGDGRRKNRIAVTSSDWSLDVAASQTGRIGLHLISTSSPMLYFAAIADAASAGAFGSIASMTVRSASLTEIDWSPTRSRLPVKDLSPSNPRPGCKTRRDASKTSRDLCSGVIRCYYRPEVHPRSVIYITVARTRSG